VSVGLRGAYGDGNRKAVTFRRHVLQGGNPPLSTKLIDTNPGLRTFYIYVSNNGPPTILMLNGPAPSISGDGPI